MTKEKVELLSVIVPAYKQEQSIVSDLKRINRVLDDTGINYEIICVADGQSDDTYSLAKELQNKNLHVVGYHDNKGKGYAVRYGMERAKGDCVAFIDAGMEIHPNGLSMLLEHMHWYRSDIIVGSLRHSASKVKGYPLIRQILSWGYHTLTKMLFGLNITDSQRGIKIFKREVLDEVLPRLEIQRYAFDIEMLAVAHWLGFDRIHDGPVEFDAHQVNYSSVTPKTVWSMFWDTMQFYYRLKIKKEYKNKPEVKN